MIELVKQQKRRMVMPLVFFPGVKLTHSTIRQNEFNAKLQFETLQKLHSLLQPDGMFYMMDLSVEAGALGLPVRYPANESSTVESHPIKKPADLATLKVLDPLEDCRVKVFLEVTQRMHENFKTINGAYVSGPFSLAALLMGATETAMKVIDDAKFVHEVVEFSTAVITAYAKALVDRGADGICLLEPTGVILSPAHFKKFSGDYVKKIVSEIDVPAVLHICGNTNHLLKEMVATGVDGLSLDSVLDLPTAASTVPPDVVLIGNLNPVELTRWSEEEVARETLGLLEKMKGFENFILSSGCDLPPETPIENIQSMLTTARNFPVP